MNGGGATSRLRTMHEEQNPIIEMMNAKSNLLKVALLGCVLFFTSNVVGEENDQQPLWKKVDGWQIRVDTTLDNSCFLVQLFEGFTVLRLGFNKPAQTFYVLVGDKDWESIEVGKEYPIQIRFGNARPWGGNAGAIDIGVPALTLSLRKAESITKFLGEFMRKSSVKIAYRNKTITHLSLKSSFKAGRELLACQEVLDKTQERKDPFNRKDKKSTDDPFIHTFS